MREQRGQSNIPMEVQEVHENIATLSTEVARLQDIKAGLEQQIELDKRNNIDYTKNQILLNELIKDIEIKRSIVVTVTAEMNEVSNKVFLAKKDLESIEVSIEQKLELEKEVERLKNAVVVIQQSMETYEDEFQEKKKKAQLELDLIKNQMISLHDSMKVVINRE